MRLGDHYIKERIKDRVFHYYQQDQSKKLSCYPSGNAGSNLYQAPRAHLSIKLLMRRPLLTYIFHHIQNHGFIPRNSLSTDLRIILLF
jgi:hypothetical protein